MAELNPCTKPPSIWAFTSSGLIALPTSNAETAFENLNLAGVQVDLDVESLRADRVVHDGAVALAGFRVEAGDIGRHEFAAPDDGATRPLGEIVVGQAVNHHVFQRLSLLPSCRKSRCR